MRDSWSRQLVRDVVEQVKRAESLQSGKEYQLLGVRWYAGGPFARERVSRESSKANRVYRVEAGDFIYNRLFAWKGSFGVVSAELAGSYVSGEFPVFIADQSKVLPEYLFHYMARPAIWDQILLESTGSTATSRNRWKEDRFLASEIDLPPVQEQRRIVDLIASIDSAISEGLGHMTATESVLASMREAVWEAHIDSAVPLGEVVSIEAKLVDPTLPAHRRLLHIGVAQIEKDSGRLVDGQTAEEEGVTSSKFLFTPEDIIYAKIRPNLRKVAVPRFTGLCSADAYPLRPAKGVDADFLREMLLSKSFTAAAVARSGRTKMPKVNRTELLAIEVPNPALEIQRERGLAFAEVRASLETVRQILGDLTKLREQVLSSLLFGSHEIPASYDRFLEEASS